MFIPFFSHSRARRSQAWRVDIHPNDDPLTSRLDDSNSYIVFIKESIPTHPLERRKGGGGRGRGKSSGSALSVPLLITTAYFSPPVHVGSSNGSKSGKTSKVSLGGSKLPNGKTSATSYGAGGGRAAPIPLSRPFAGRFAGGGTREEVYGNRYAIRTCAFVPRALTYLYPSAHSKCVWERLPWFCGLAWRRGTRLPVLLLADCLACPCHRRWLILVRSQ
jgi:hypothetical protein